MIGLNVVGCHLPMETLRNTICDFVIVGILWCVLAQTKTMSLGNITIWHYCEVCNLSLTKAFFMVHGYTSMCMKL
jgi:hypothetical protein